MNIIMSMMSGLDADGAGLAGWSAMKSRKGLDDISVWLGGISISPGADYRPDGGPMPRIISLDDALLSGFEYPVALVVEVTKKGVVLSKLRYLKALGQLVNETMRCPCIEVYVHADGREDPYTEMRGGRPVGIDWIFHFNVNNALFSEAMAQVRDGELRLNINNPQTQHIAARLLGRLDRRGGVNYRRMDGIEKGLLLEPYCNLAFQRAGKGKRVILQNVEVMNTEPTLRVRQRGVDVIYAPEPAPHMEIDLLVIAEISDVRSILDGLAAMGFRHDKRAAPAGSPRITMV
jgi:hypothetical protein